MAPSHSRRDILRGSLRGSRSTIMRPPGAQPDFDRLCDDCGACSRACPERIVRHAKSGGPELDFSHGACTFCGDCARACPTGALVEAEVGNWPWRATIGQSCLSHQGIACRACEDACEPRAIRFRLETGGRAVPVLTQDQCTGCGECAFTCPAGAVAFERRQPAKSEITA
ncbi:ferredoxin-type protein NapF [Tropicibacter oceani]|uniref:Ferredoxin-type protein NapF n=1 Tax=Tropicibacter oceani TaxID=3058420 RepID=A0ABY8QGB1_9RHOB|nr:ferredoxin-type protein NapF [Tropicibacter oceani]WGW03630.1 ferredoxin-type protein NapF [Tropicibacter oceani]